MAIELNRENATWQEIEEAKESSPEKEQFIRLWGIQRLMEGWSRVEVARNFGRNYNTVTQWVKRFNESGIDGLRSVKNPGRPRKLSYTQVVDIKRLLLNPQILDRSHWTLVKLHGYLKEKWAKEISLSTLHRYVKELGFSHIVPRSWPEKQDAQAREKFLKNLNEKVADPKNEVWFCDESGVVGDPRPRKRWTAIGSRPKVPFTGAHIRQSVIGAVQPGSGELEALVVPQVDSAVFQVFIDMFAKATQNREKRIILVMDNATWHKAKILDWHHIIPMYLPAYSPDLNPIERLWAQLKAEFFTDWIARTHDELTLRLIEGMYYFMENSSETASICSL